MSMAAKTESASPEQTAAKDSPLQQWRAARAQGLRAAWPEVPRFALGMALTVAMTTMIFQPAGWWPLAFICLAPWCAVALTTRTAWLVHWGSLFGGYVFFLINLVWLMPVTGLGYAALALYLALYWVMAAWALRTAARAGVGPTWTLPVVWVATEYLRGWVMSGFPWLFIGHAFYKQLHLIQVADLTGAYGVTFAALIVNGALAQLWRLRTDARDQRANWRRVALPIVSAGAVVGAVLGYGNGRLNAAALTPGPRVAVVQEDFPLISRPPYGENPLVVLARTLRLATEAARQEPDLLVFPETAWSSTQNVGFLRNERQAVPSTFAGAWSYGKHAHDATTAFVRGDYPAVNRILSSVEAAYGPALEKDGVARLPRLPPEPGPAVTAVVGAVSIDLLPGAAYRYRKANSALIYDPDGTQRLQRYDKTHLVPFGEAVPFRNQQVFGISLHWLYRWLNSLSPFSRGGKDDYSLWPGEQFTIFDLVTAERTYRFGVPICYEDVMPYVARSFCWGPRGEKRVDFLVNISNDGWFLHSAELEQHLAICTFRAVENRVGIARAVNTGISGFIDSNGRNYGLVQQDGRLIGPGITGVSSARVMIDPRATIYGRWGDWFAGLCLLLSLPLWIGGMVTRWAFGIWNHLVLRKPRPVEDE